MFVNTNCVLLLAGLSMALQHCSTGSAFALFLMNDVTHYSTQVALTVSTIQDEWTCNGSYLMSPRQFNETCSMVSRSSV